MLRKKCWNGSAVHRKLWLEVIWFEKESAYKFLSLGFQLTWCYMDISYAATHICLFACFQPYRLIYIPNIFYSGYLQSTVRKAGNGNRFVINHLAMVWISMCLSSNTNPQPKSKATYKHSLGTYVRHGSQPTSIIKLLDEYGENH